MAARGILPQPNPTLPEMKKLLKPALLGFLATTFSLVADAQNLQWTIIDSSDFSEVATVSGNSINFDVPAGSTYWAVTNNFQPMDLSSAGVNPVTFTLSSTAGFEVNGNTRVFGVGLFNSGGTIGTGSSNFSDDNGYFWQVNDGGTYLELRKHYTGTANIFAIDGNFGTGGGGAGGDPINDTVYAGKHELTTDGAGNVRFGTSSSSEALAGASMVGTGFEYWGYTNYEALNSGDATMDQFAVYFNNASGGTATVSLGNVSLTAVPEPAQLASMLGLAALALVCFRRSRRNRA